MENEIKETITREKINTENLKFTSSELKILFPTDIEGIFPLINSICDEDSPLHSLIKKEKSDRYISSLMDWNHILSAIYSLYLRLKGLEQQGVNFKELKEKGYI